MTIEEITFLYLAFVGSGMLLGITWAFLFSWYRS